MSICSVFLKDKEKTVEGQTWHDIDLHLKMNYLEYGKLGEEFSV